VALLAGLGVVVGVPATATTAQDDPITRYDVTIELDDDGVAHVDLALDVDFGQDPNRGPYLTYVVKQRFDDTRDRVYRITDVQASSPTAPDEVHLAEDGGLLEVRIGDEDRDDLTGVHSYRVTYRVEGWVSSAAALGLEGDELFLNVVGDAWVVPVLDVTVTVVGPDEVLAVRCYAGPDDTCAEQDADGATATFAEPALDPGEPLTVAVAYAAGTFGGVEPLLQERWAASRAFAVTPVTGGLAGLIALTGVGAVVGHARRTGRDEQFAGLTPGPTPVERPAAAPVPRRAAPVAVRFTPPDGLRPGQLGTLVDERADARDVTATLLDLAVRGHVTITEVADDDAEDWTLTRTGEPDDGLLTYERRLLDGLFADRLTVRLSEVRGTFTSTMSDVQRLLYEDVTARGWFRGDPSAARTGRAALGALALLAALAATVALAVWTTFAVLGVAAVVVAVAVLATTGAAPARTARGTAVLQETQGFRRYLETAEADQLRLEESLHVFSRHLPFAVAFGLTERWARVLQDLAARGVAPPEPAWYVARTPAALWAGGAFGDRVESFARTASSAITAPTPGSSGSSGFTAGSAGSGVGGGGGGTW
jgi:hypothetical protein